MMIRSFVVTCVLVSISSITYAENWPGWRGPKGTGVANESDVPLEWSSTKNIQWKTPLPGPGNSTPVVWGVRVFVTCPNAAGTDRHLLCFDRNTGKELWRQTVEFSQKEETHKTNPQCSASPAVDGDRVVVWHGSAGVFCYSHEGKELWRKDLGVFEHIWGTASSPLLYDGKVFLNCGPGTRAFVTALNIENGDEVWRREIKTMVSEKVDQFRGSWSTPVVTEGDRPLILLSLPKTMRAVDPDTGQDVWTCEGMTDLVYTSPLVNDKFVVAMCGYGGNALAIPRGGKGDMTAKRLWHHTEKKKIPQRVGSGVLVGEHIYINNEPGIAWCMNAATGEILWQQRLGGKAWSSMVHVDGNLYVINMDGATFVLEPNPKECVVLAENKLDETTRGSLAFSNGQIFIHTYEHLYCVGK